MAGPRRNERTPGGRASFRWIRTALLILLVVAVPPPVLGGSPMDLPAVQAPLPPDTFPGGPVQILPGLPDGLVLIPSSPVLESRLRFVHWPGDEARATRLLNTIEANPYLPGLPREVPSQATIYIAPNVETWNVLTGGRIPEWGAGVAIPSRRIAVIPVDQGMHGGLVDRDRTVLHEWAHLGLHEHLSGLRIPRWFDEGYAQWASGGWNVQEAWRLRLALARGSAPPLDSLALAWPSDRASAELAYLLSASAVEFLISESGERGMEVFLARWKEVGSFEEAFRSTFGLTTGTFETRWLEHVRRRYSWILVLYQTAAFWLFAGIALLLLIRIRRRRDRERMARLRATEAPDLPAYWEGPRTPPIGGFQSDRAGERHSSEVGGATDPPRG